MPNGQDIKSMYVKLHVCVILIHIISKTVLNSLLEINGSGLWYELQKYIYFKILNKNMLKSYDIFLCMAFKLWWM